MCFVPPISTSKAEKVPGTDPPRPQLSPTSNGLASSPVATSSSASAIRSTSANSSRRISDREKVSGTENGLPATCLGSTQNARPTSPSGSSASLCCMISVCPGILHRCLNAARRCFVPRAPPAQARVEKERPINSSSRARSDPPSLPSRTSHLTPSATAAV